MTLKAAFQLQPVCDSVADVINLSFFFFFFKWHILIFYTCILKCRLPKILTDHIAVFIERDISNYFLYEKSFKVNYYSVFKLLLL